MYNVCVYMMCVLICVWSVYVCVHAHATAYMEGRGPPQLLIFTFHHFETGLHCFCCTVWVRLADL